jgi:hypothetical protein
MRETQHKRIPRRTCTALRLSGLPVQSPLDRGPCGLTDLPVAGLCGKEADEKVEKPIGLRPFKRVGCAVCYSPCYNIRINLKLLVLEHTVVKAL